MKANCATKIIEIEDIEIDDVKQNEYKVLVKIEDKREAIFLRGKELARFCSAITQHTEADVRRRAVFALSNNSLPLEDIIGEHEVTRRWITEYLS